MPNLVRYIKRTEWFGDYGYNLLPEMNECSSTLPLAANFVRVQLILPGIVNRNINLVTGW